MHIIHEYQMNFQSSQKKIKQFIVSYGEGQLLGKSIKGQLRTGCDNNNNKLFVFLINSLPISKQCQKMIDLQIKYSNLSQVSRKIEAPVQSMSNQYLPMQYFPKTFQSQMQEMKLNQMIAINLVRQFLQSYALLYYMRISHNNFSIKNIGVTSENKVKFMDFKSNDTLPFNECSMKDLKKFIQIMNPIFQKRKQNKKFKVFYAENATWNSIFKEWEIQEPLSKLYLNNKNVKHTLNNLVAVYNSIQNRNQESYYLKVSLLIVMQKIKQKASKVKSSFLFDYKLNLIQATKSTQQLEFYHTILADAIKDPQYFQLSSTQRLCLTINLIPELNHLYCKQSLNDNLIDNNPQFDILAQILLNEFKVLQILENIWLIDSN